MGNVNMEASQINYRGGEKKMSVEEALKNTSGEAAAIAQLQTDVLNLNSNKANQNTIAPFFSAEASYDPGDLVYYNGLSYRCVNAHEGEWDADDFAATTVANELSSLKSGLTNYIANTGVKNLIPIPFLYKDVSGDGLTYTINNDGTVEIDGTASATKRFYIIAISSNFIFEKGQTYTLTDGTSDSDNGKYVLELALFNGNTYANKAFRTANGSVTFTLPTEIEYDRVTLYLVVYKGVQLSHKLFKPMMRYSAVKNADYVYAKTNKQLTEQLPDAPNTDGTYNLQVTVSSGTPSYSWVSTS